MSIQDAGVEVTIRLPRDLYDEVEATARNEHRQVRDLLESAVITGLGSRASIDDVLRRTAEATRAAGANVTPPEQVLDDLRRTREQIASEFYP